MKIERTIIAVFFAVIITVALSGYYIYQNMNESTKIGSLVRHTHKVIEGVYQLEFEAANVENASTKFTLTGMPYYAALARQNAIELNRLSETLPDSVKDDSAQLQKALELKGMILEMEKQLPGLDAFNYTNVETGASIFKNGSSEVQLDKILSKAEEINREEFVLQTKKRNISQEARDNSTIAVYITICSAFILIMILLIRLNYLIQKWKRAEVLAHENEEKFRSMVEEVGDVIYTCDYAGNFTYINARLTNLTGHLPEELIGKHFSFIVPPSWIERVKEFYFQQFKHFTHETRYEFQIFTKEGQLKWVEQNVTLIPKGKKIDSFQCIVRDITQRKNAEEELRKTNQFLDSILDNIPNMIFIKDAKYLRFIRFNRAGEELLGYLQSDLLGKNDYDFFPKEQADFFTGKDRLVLKSKTGMEIMEEPIVTKHGERWLHTRKIPLIDPQGVPIYLLGISEDITERKRTEDTIIELNKNLARYVAELEESQRFYKTIAHNFPDGTISVLDQNLYYLFVDGRELLNEGLTAEYLIGTNYLERFPPGARNELQEKLLEVFKGKNITFEVVLADKYYSINAAPLGNPEDKINEIMIVKQNITQHKLAEENIRTAFEKEKQINELKTRFVSLASHEFRTPLSTILSSTALIEEYMEHDNLDKAVLREKNVKHLKRIKSAINNMVGILNGFLNLDKLEHGKTEVSPENIDIKAFSTEVVEELIPNMKAGQSITYMHKSTQRGVRVDRQMLKNVVINLLSNAIKYSPRNSVITFYTTINDSGLELEFIDKGIGIPEGEQSSLFERFFRARNTMHIEGTGLGLSIVKRYVDLMNGRISFTSRENEGTIFKVFISNSPILHPITNLINETL